MNEPSIRFFPDDRMIVSQDSLAVECQYWVQWGEQIWNVEIIGVQGQSGDDAYIARLIARALGGTAKGRVVIKRDGRIISGSPTSFDAAPDRIV